jgi:hypothetical protein
MRLRKEGIDSMARVNAARDIFAALPGIWTRSRMEELSAPKTACTAVQPSLPIAFGEEYMVERTISVH